MDQIERLWYNWYHAMRAIEKTYSAGFEINLPI